MVIMDQAGWHTTKKTKIPQNISILHLPPYSPEINPQENIWQYLKSNFLSNRVFNHKEDIINACVDGWLELINFPLFISSIATRERARLNYL